MNQIIVLLSKLVALESTPRNPENNLKCLKSIKKVLFKSGVNSKIGMNNGKSYLISGSPTANLLLLGHVDVVPGSKDLFIPRVSENKMFGRGTFDMKGPVAAMVDAYVQLKSADTDSNICLALTSDEEIGGHNGAEFLSQKILKPKLVIVPDGGENFELVVEQKGSINIITKSFGKSAHSSRPWEGRDTIELAAKFILAIKKMFPDNSITRTTAIPTIVVSGDIDRKQVKNQIPEVCEIHWNVRIAKNISAKSILSKFKEVGNITNTKIDGWEGDGISFSANKNDPYLKLWKSSLEKLISKKLTFRSLSSASDARFFSKKGITCIVTEVVGGGAHSDSEWVNLKSLNSLSKNIQLFSSALKQNLWNNKQ